MRTVILSLPLLVGSLISSPSAHAEGAWTATLAAAAKALRPKVVAWRRDIHPHPDLGNREVRTAALVAEHLRGLGPEMKIGIAHTGADAILKGVKPGLRTMLQAALNYLAGGKGEGP